MAPQRKRQAGFTGGETEPDTTALFVRIPRAEAEKLDRAAFELRAPKQALVGALLARYVDPGSEAGLRDLRRVVIETADDPLTVGRHDFRSYEQAEVLTAEQAAELLQTDAETVLELAE